MEYTKLGRTGMSISRLCLGTMNFGGRTSEKEAFAIMDCALDAGVNFFDTANVYGRNGEISGYSGLTEEIIGRWFKQGSNRREKVVLATKVYGRMSEELDGPNSPRGLSAYKIRRHLEASLKRLQTDHIELYQMHHIDVSVGWDEIFLAFEREINQGKIDYIGSSNFGGRHLAYAQAAAEKRNFLGLVSEQHQYSLLCRLPELEVIPATVELGIGFIPYSPLGGGLLTENVFSGVSGSRGAERIKSLAEYEVNQLKAYAKLCAEIGEKESDVAMAWMLANPAITSPIIGPRTLEQFQNALHVLDVKLTPDVLAKLDEIFPGPGGAGPESYAW